MANLPALDQEFNVATGLDGKIWFFDPLENTAGSQNL